MPQLILYLLMGIFFLLNALVKWVAKGARCSNLYLRNSIRGLMILTIIFSVFYIMYVYQQRDAVSFNKLIANPTIIECQNFINKYPDSKRVLEVESEINKLYEEELQAANDSLSLSRFIDKYSNNYRFKEDYKYPFLREAIRRLDKEKKRLEYERSARIKEEQLAWSSELMAWETVSERGTLDVYRKYLKLYPNGAHKSQAEKKIVDLEVANVFNSKNYGHLPSMDKTRYGKGAYTTVTVKNDTQYTLTLLYSGMESKRIVIGSHGIQNIKLKSGSYRIVASVNASRVQNFAGSEDLVGGSYSVNYYISTSRY